MDTGFVDLDFLLMKVRNGQSKAYFLDAVRAYKAGAFRAALTSAWVALVYDLISKYRELSAMGDLAAASFLTSWDNANASNDTPKLLQLEASIIDDSTKNTQILHRISGSHLQRLRDDRHLCAHPAFSAEAELYEPSQELVRLHLVNAVDLVLSQAPLQGKAIFELFDADVQSPGFPTTIPRILDYVDQRYLERVRPQNVRNFGTVLAKSLLKGVPAHWEHLRKRIALSLVAVRDRAPETWGDVSHAIVKLIDNLEPTNRSNAIAFIAEFPDFWPLLENSTRIALQQTVESPDGLALGNYRILTGVGFPQFRSALLGLIANLDGRKLADAIAAQPHTEMWPRAIELYAKSGSYRGSEENFRGLISPFGSLIRSHQFDQLLDAVVENGQNWDAAETVSLLLSFLQNTSASDRPGTAARNRFYQVIRGVRRLERYEDFFSSLRTDGWEPRPAEPDDEM